MPDLESRIAEWRKTLKSTPNVGPDVLAELENHLRETVAELVRSGVPETEAFQRAVAQLGQPAAVASEFQKLNATHWLPARVVTVLVAVAALGLSTALFAAFQHRHMDWLLIAHLFSVTLGYTTTLLLGILGLCFVAQRCHADFPPRRLQSLSHITFAYARMALGLTVMGILLGMAWSHREWGRYWNWDPREAGALAVVVWLAGYLLAHRWRRITARGLLICSLLGSNIVFLAWFGPHLLLWGRLHSYGISVHATSLVVVALAINALFFAIGFASAGWLRLHRV